LPKAPLMFSGIPSPVMSVSVNDIIRRNDARYRSLQPNIPMPELKFMRALTACRTENDSIRIEQCDACGHDVTWNNSCSNRHCPLCQHGKKEEWIDWFLKFLQNYCHKKGLLLYYG